MPVESDNDRAHLLADFGQLVTFSPGETYPNRNNETAEITGIFDKAFFEIVGDLVAADSNQPVIVCRTIDVAGAERNSMVEIGADTYKVVGVEPDGTGITLLLLEGPRL